MAKSIVNNMHYLPFDVKVFHNVNLENVMVDKDLRCLLDAHEAGKFHLNVSAYHETVGKILKNTDGESRMNVVLVEKTSGKPVGLATFLRHNFEDVGKVAPLLRPDIGEALAPSSRKVYYELQYCLRRSDMRGKCIGDLLLACGLEALGNVPKRRPGEVSVWLELAGSFDNLNALNLYTKFKFCIIGIHDGKTVIMVLSNVQSHLEKAKNILQQSLEASFLLPRLKEKCLPVAQNASNGNGAMPDEQQMEDSTPQQEDEHQCSQGISESSQSTVDSSQSPRSSQHANEPAEVRQETATEPVVEEDRSQVGEEELRGLTFRKYVDQLKWFSNHLVISVSGVPPQDMVRNMSLMSQRVEKVDRCFSFFQHLQMAKQIEAYAALVNQDSYSVLKDIETQLQDTFQVKYSERYLKKIVRVSWCVHRYSFLEQADLTWTDSLSIIPRAAEAMDRRIVSENGFPENILDAQRDHFSVYLKISIQFPELFPPGDGDGMSSCKLVQIHGVFMNEQRIDDALALVSKFQDITKNVGEHFRCRLVGFDTQEAPCEPAPGRIQRLVPVPQHFWKLGRDFLTSQLNQLRGSLQQSEVILLCDCYGRDVYERLLVDLRGVKRRGSDEEELQTSLGRFEMARRFLENGVAHPTYQSYTDDTLIRAFVTARENGKGAFGDPEGRPFNHPSEYRRKRRQMVIDMRRETRPRYKE